METITKEQLQKLLKSMWDEISYVGYGTARVKMIFEDKVEEFNLDDSFLPEDEA